MSVNPNPEKGPRPPRGDHAQGERTDAESPERVASADSRAHGTHGKGDARERLVDEQAVDGEASGGSSVDRRPDDRGA